MKRTIVAIAAAIAAVAAHGALAQGGYPSRVVRFIVPVAAHMRADGFDDEAILADFVSGAPKI